MKNSFRFLCLCITLMTANSAHAFYDAVLGRFATRDPIGEYGGVNLYAYVGNNPVNHTDRLGLMNDETAGLGAGPAAPGLGGGAEGEGGGPGPVESASPSGKGPAPELGNEASGQPRPSPNFLPPTNAPQFPPDQIRSGYGLRIMRPTSQYPNGYWRMYNAEGQPVDPSTMQPPSNCSRAQFQARTHVPLPASWWGVSSPSPVPTPPPISTPPPPSTK